MDHYLFLEWLAGEKPYNRERVEEYNQYFKKLYGKRFANKNRHGKIKLIKKYEKANKI